MIVVIWLVVTSLFVNWRAGVVAIVPMLLPILVFFGVMGFVGIPLDTTTSMVAAISLGVCDVHSLHFMARYHYHTREHGDERRALADTAREELLPIAGTSTALALGFATFSLSSFPPVVYFGLLSAMVMLVSLVATFTVLPILLSTTPLVTLWDLVTLEIKPAVLRQCDLFRGLRRWQVKRLVLMSGLRRFGDGETIVRQGEIARDMFVILDGGARAWRRDAGTPPTLLRDMGPGEIFGELALVCATPRTADVVATGETRVLVLEWERVRRLGRVLPAITSPLFLNLASAIGRRLGGSSSCGGTSGEGAQRGPEPGPHSSG
jgi:hypothetical protein